MKSRFSCLKLSSSTLPLWTVTVWLTLQSSEHQNDQTQEQFLPPSNPSHEHLTLNVEHTTLFTLFIHHTYFFFISILHISDLYTHNCLYYILCFCYFVHCLFVYYSFIICVLSCCCHSVALWSFCHYNKFLVCVNIPGNKAHSDSDSSKPSRTKLKNGAVRGAEMNHAQVTASKWAFIW